MKNDADNSMLYIDDGKLKSDAVFMWKLMRKHIVLLLLLDVRTNLKDETKKKRFFLALSSIF